MNNAIRRLAPLALLCAAATVLPVPALAAPGEIILHITARGSVPPDFLTLPVPVSGSGPTREEAEASLKLQQEQVVKEMADAGIDASKAMLSPIETTQQALTCGETVECAAADAAAAAMDAAAEPTAKLSKRERKKREAEAAAARAALQWTSSATLTVEMDFAKLPELQKHGGTAALAGWPMAFGMGAGGANLFGFRDRAASHAAALGKAMAAARTEADAYAGALGYRVVRIAGASNAPAPFSGSDLVSMYGKMDGMFRDPAMVASEVANVTIDFVIAPR